MKKTDNPIEWWAKDSHILQKDNPKGHEAQPLALAVQSRVLLLQTAM